MRDNRLRSMAMVEPKQGLARRKTTAVTTLGRKWLLMPSAAYEDQRPDSGTP